MPDTSTEHLLMQQNNAVASIHFRFMFKTNVSYHTLQDSLFRVSKEIERVFKLPIYIDLNGYLNLSLYPFEENSSAENSSHIYKFKECDIDVYTNGSFVCGKPDFTEGSELVEEGMLSLFYREQFVFRAGLFLLSENVDLSLLKEALNLLMVNIDIPGIKLLSIQCNGEKKHLFPLPESFLPGKSESFCYQPIYGMTCRETDFVPLSKLGLKKDQRLNSSAINNSHIGERVVCHTVPIAIESNGETELFQSTLLTNDDNDEFSCTIRQKQIFRPGSYGYAPKILAEECEGVVYPVWVLSHGQDSVIVDVVFEIPQLSSVEAVFYAARGYHDRALLGDVSGMQYNTLFLASELKTIRELVQKGMLIERDVDEDGRVFFNVNIINERDQEESIRIGSEVYAETFFTLLSKFDVDEVGLELLYQLADEANNSSDSAIAENPPVFFN